MAQNLMEAVKAEKARGPLSKNRYAELNGDSLAGIPALINQAVYISLNCRGFQGDGTFIAEYIDGAPPLSVAEGNEIEAELYLGKCDVSDAGLMHVTRLTRLRAINLYGTRLTSAGLESLTGLEQLRLLSVSDVKLKPTAVDQLRSKLPRQTVTDYTPV